MRQKVQLLRRFTGLPEPAIVLAGLNISAPREFLRRMAAYSEALEGSARKTDANVVVFLWLGGHVDESEALDVLLELPAGEQWAELVLSWTPQERAAALEALESDGWTQSTIEAL